MIKPLETKWFEMFKLYAAWRPWAEDMDDVAWGETKEDAVKALERLESVSKTD